MRTLPARRKSLEAGFTLVELMVSIIVATILISIAIPSYTSQMRKSRRTEARTALLDLAQREERFMSTNTSYSADQVNLGYSTSTNTSWSNVPVGSGYYRVSVCVAAASPCTGAATTGSVYLLTATAIGAQAKDTTCATFTVDNTGQQAAADSSGNAATTCW
jgi:type IV pilus assembly protein PilE